MCSVLQLPRSTYYYEATLAEAEPDEFTDAVIKIFQESRNNYGTRKIKKELAKLGHQREWQEDGCGEMEEFQHAHHSSNHAEPVL